MMVRHVMKNVGRERERGREQPPHCSCVVNILESVKKKDKINSELPK